MNLKEYRLGDLIEVTRGASLAGDSYATEGKYKRITLGNFNYKEGGFKDDTQKEDIYYTGKVDERFILRKGDILTPLTEQALGLLGSTIRIPEDDKYIQSQDAALITCKEGLLDPDFCYYLISSSQVRNQLSAAAQQTKIRHTSPDKIKACKVFIPELAEQKKIGQYLRLLEEKIFINRQINQNLEALARQLYDYWFVQFDFPDENGKPYKSSGGAMVYNEQLKREIPKGWEYFTTDKLTNVITGKEDANFSVPNGAYPFFTCSRENLRCATPAFAGKAILIAGNGDFNVKHYNGTFNAYQRTYVLIPKDSKYYGVLYFAALERIDLFKAKSNGSIIKFITKGDVENIGVYDCHKPEIYKQINTLIEAIETNECEIASLIKQRDELLPLLMNGQVNFDLLVWYDILYYLYIRV